MFANTQNHKRDNYMVQKRNSAVERRERVNSFGIKKQRKQIKQERKQYSEISSDSEQSKDDEARDPQSHIN